MSEFWPEDDAGGAGLAPASHGVRVPADKFVPDIICARAAFSAGADFGSASFGGTANFESASFGVADFVRASFSAGLSAPANFERASFRDAISGGGSYSWGTACFLGTVFSSVAIFWSAVFSDGRAVSIGYA